MKILVTGGAGFIGKHLIKSLLENNNIITIFDNFSNSTKKSVEYLIKKGVKIIEGDIINSEEILDASKNQDIVIHLAAKISVIKSIKNPLETFEVNVNGTTNVLIACEKNNIKKLIVSSSAAVYGQGVKDIKIVENKKLKPISPYGESKMRMEEQIDEYVRNKKIKCIILRFFNIYGINQSDEYAGVITKFLKRIKQGKNLEVFGNGMQTRDFVSIKDVINSINNAILYKKSGTYNIATGEAITIKKLAEKMIYLSKKNVKILYLDIKNSEIEFSQASIESSKKDLKYNPKINLDIGIKELLEK
jgi:UDP-glucose 4-epimerase|tara:strand:- start:1145 stop:2056 length:912 start_codon:yes stop_codon:yes gene_type:complete